MRGIITVVLLSVALCLNACSKTKGDFNAGLAAYQKKDYAAAIKELEPLAEHGNAQASYYMARIVMDGYTGGTAQLEKTDAEAEQWLRKSSDQGYAEATYHLAYFYAGREYLTSQKTRETLLKAADQGHAKAQLEISELYQKDVVAAYAVLSISAENQGEREKFSNNMTQEQINEGQLLAKRMMDPGGSLSKELKKR